MSRLALGGLLPGLLFGAGVLVAPVSAQCAVISVDRSCAGAVRPSVRVDFGVTPPAELAGGGRRVTSLIDRSSARVPLLMREPNRDCRELTSHPQARRPAGHTRAHVLDAPGRFAPLVDVTAPRPRRHVPGHTRPVHASTAHDPCDP